MEPRKLLRTIAIVIVLICNVGCDQISKAIVRQRIDYNEEIGLIYPYVTLTKIENSGAFLSLGGSLSYPVRFILLSLIPVLALSYGLFFLFTRTNISKPVLIGLCFVIGGGIGNIYDRVVFGSVTDFLHIDLVIFQTGIFNMADVSITLGILLIFISSLFKWKQELKSDA